MNDITPEKIAEMEMIEKMKKTVMSKILTKDAIERLGRLRLVKPELAEQLELYLLQLYQNGQIKETITDDQIKTILNAITKKKEFKIRR